MTRSQIEEMFPIGDPWARRILFDPITAVLGGASILTNVIGGIAGKKAAKSAAELQAQAAEKAGEDVKRVTAETNPAILEAAGNAGAALNTRADLAAQGVSSSVDRANNLLDPYRAAGDEANQNIREGIAAGGQFAKTPTAADIQMDPGFAFRQKETADAIARQGAALGINTSGGFGVDFARKLSGFNSQEYQAAFERFRANRNDLFGYQNTIAGRGREVASEEGRNLVGAAQYGGDITTGATRTSAGWDVDATNRTSQNTIDAQRQASDYNTQAADARASGKVAGTNTLVGGITGGVNAATSALQFNQLKNVLKNPTAGVATTSRPGSLNLLLPYGRKAA